MGYASSRTTDTGFVYAFGEGDLGDATSKTIVKIGKTSGDDHLYRYSQGVAWNLHLRPWYSVAFPGGAGSALQHEREVHTALEDIRVTMRHEWFHWDADRVLGAFRAIAEEYGGELREHHGEDVDEPLLPRRTSTHLEASPLEREVRRLKERLAEAEKKAEDAVQRLQWQYDKYNALQGLLQALGQKNPHDEQLETLARCVRRGNNRAYVELNKTLNTL